MAVKAEAVVNAYTSDQSNSKLNDVLAYLLMTNPDSTKKDFVDYSAMTLKDLRKKLLNALVNYEQQQGDTVEQNQKRYLSILALSCSDWQDSGKVGADDGSWAISRLEKELKLVVSNQSMGTILRLAGLSNRPYEELVGAEYSIDFDLGGVDEKNGDIFIICTFDSETKTYVPFMMANEYGAQNFGLKIAEDENASENTWTEKFNYLNSYSDYYAVNPSIDPVGEQPSNKKFVYYPIIARGLVYSDGMPTAIREVDGNIEYYRDDVVIRDASDIGLETYYLSMDQVTVHHSLVSSIVNGFTKLFTGKTLVEQIASSIPRFAAHTDYNFCYGVDDTIKFTSQDGVSYMSFNFNTGTNFSTKYKLDCVYQMDRLNVLILLIGTIGILSAVWKALWGAAGRILDIAVDVLIGPAVVATLNLKYDQISDKEVKEVGFESYDKWKQKTQDDLLGVFAYAIGFNIFFIIVPIITGLNLFSTADAFATLPLINKLSLSFLNEIGRLIFLVGAAYLMKRAPALFAKVSGTGDGFAAGERVYGSVKNTINTVRDVVSGQELIDKVKDAKENALNMIPGRQLAKKITQKTIANATFVAASAAGIASGQGVLNSVRQAHKMKKTMEAEFEKEEKLRQKRKDEREKRNKDRQYWMDDYKPGEYDYRRW